MNFRGCMGLCLVQEQAERQIPELPAAPVFEHSDIPKPVCAVPIPDPAGGAGNAILIDQGIPAERIQIIRAAGKNRFPDRNERGNIVPGGKPFSLNHNNMRLLKLPHQKGYRNGSEKDRTYQ